VRCIRTTCCASWWKSRGKHQLIVYADEVYDKTLYDGATHTSIASLADDLLFVTFNGLSKNYRACGYRTGWMVVVRRETTRAGLHRGPEHPRVDAPLRQRARAIRRADRAGRLPEHQGSGRACRAAVPPARPRLETDHRDSRGLLREAQGGACTCFRAWTPSCIPSRTTQEFVLELLEEEKVLVVQGSGFNWPHPDHFRLVFLPNSDDLTEAIGRIARFLDGYRRRNQ